MLPDRLKSFILRVMSRKRRPQSHRTLRDRFAFVYAQREWGEAGSASGPGSDRDSGPVRQSLTALAQVCREYSIRSIADVPCGDFNWMPLFLNAQPDITYVGYDIVPAVVAANRRRHPTLRFQTLDVTRRPPARADLVFSKDMVNHLLERDVWAALANMIRSGSTYLMVTSNAGSANTELPRNFGGTSRHLNLRAAPYDFPPPLYEDGYLAVWRTSDLAFVLDHRS